MNKAISSTDEAVAGIPDGAAITTPAGLVRREVPAGTTAGAVCRATKASLIMGVAPGGF
jgi:hypothetical protein